MCRRNSMQTFLRWGLYIVFLGLLYGAGGFGAPAAFLSLDGAHRVPACICLESEPARYLCPHICCVLNVLLAGLRFSFT